MHGGRQTRRPNLIGRLTPLARRVSAHTASSSTAITNSARRALRHLGDAAPNRRPQVSLRSTTTARLSGFRSALTRCLSFDGPDEGVAMDEERKELRPAY